MPTVSFFESPGLSPKPNIEGEDTVHWFFNRGNEPAAALVCDIVAAG